MNTFKTQFGTAKQRRISTSCLIAIFLATMATPSLLAGASPQSGQWWGAVELGGGQLNRKAPGLSDNNTRFYFGLEGGLAVNPQLLLGVEVSGWSVKSGDLQNPCKGSGVSQFFAVAKIYPPKVSTFHLHLGAGAVTGWDNAAAGSRRSGTGWEVGIGYDVMISTHGAITPFLRYSNGKAGNLKLDAVTLGVGFTWR